MVEDGFAHRNLARRGIRTEGGAKVHSKQLIMIGSSYLEHAEFSMTRTSWNEVLHLLGIERKDDFARPIRSLERSVVSCAIPHPSIDTCTRCAGFHNVRCFHHGPLVLGFTRGGGGSCPCGLASMELRHTLPRGGCNCS